MGVVDMLVERVAAVLPQKAITGPGARAWDMGLPSSTGSRRARDPRAQRAFIREALGTYHTHRFIKRAEQVIAARVGGLGWHLEDPDGNEIGEESPPEQVAVRDLLEKPTGGQRLGTQPATRRELWGLTVRHAGLVNLAVWYLDEINRLTGWPKQILYIRPDRMTPVVNDNGELVAWSLDQGADGKGVRLELEEVLVFYLEPPDDGGHYGSGLVEAALTMVTKTQLADRHEIDVLGSGGRLAGIVSPKLAAGMAVDTTAFDRLQTDMRNIVDLPDAAKRAIVARAPVDFVPTASNLEELQAVERSRLLREEVFGLWGVNPTLAGFPAPVGLSSGDSRKYDKESTWENACQPRVDMLQETLQFQLLDRLDKVGIDLQLMLHTPTFEDDMPKFEMASKAREQPLSVDQRLELLGLPPVGGELGRTIFLPLSLVPAGLVPEEPGGESAVAPPAREPAGEESTEELAEEPAKARLGIRAAGDRLVPRLRREIAAFLNQQRDEILRRLERNARLVERKPGDASVWWDTDERWNEALEKVLAPFAETLADLAAEKVSATLEPTGKAGLAELTGSKVLDRLLKRVGVRIKGINETTRKELAGLVRTGIEEGASPAELGRRIRESTAFSSHRAENIARTETGTVLNEAQLESFREFDVEHVRVSDGDGDQVCADANGATWTVDEAFLDPLGHPSCTRDFAPVVGGL